MHHTFYNLLSILPTHNHNLFVKYFDYFNVQTYFNRNFVPESIIKILFDKIKDKKFILNHLLILIFQEEKELFLKYLIEDKVIHFQACLANFSFSENFFEYFKELLKEVKHREIYFIKSCKNLSNKWILNNLDKIPV